MADPYLETAQEFIDFINQQVGMYTDSLSGFSNNKIIVERQIMRIRKSYPSVDEKGNKVMMSTSYEDPSKPDIIQFRILKATDFIAENSPSGAHEQQHSRAILIFIYTFWEEEIRQRLADIKGIEKNLVRSEIMNDLRLLRHSILHEKGVLSKEKRDKLVKLKDFFSSNSPLIMSYDVMQKVFVLAKQDIFRLVTEFMGNTSVKPEEIKDIAIQFGSRTPKKPS